MDDQTEDGYILGVDVGGSHITAALVNAGNGCLVTETISRNSINKNGLKEEILKQWITTLRSSLSKISASGLKGIGFAMPGPFNYEKGICLMEGVNKYNALYGLNITDYIRGQLKLTDSFPIKFENDASCFALGESLSAEAMQFNKIIAITLGTGFGGTFLHNNQIQKNEEGVPPSGQLYNIPYLNGIAEDFISSKRLLKHYNELTGETVTEVLQIAERALTQQDENAKLVFREFGTHLADCLIPWIKSFKPGCLFIGGSISKSSHLFLSPLQLALLKDNIQLTIKISALVELSAIKGAASLISQYTNIIS